ncbi:HVO_2922 family protein [Halomarina ordinaria]|uniref:HVO_2922 family protein n=1 Tax=Halomarina ordinaria TaxID=3033939 RepID=A0ABD5U7V9_9EURY|nr:HVO_2922 family protein [Halomarina sp. PSRA2]
MTERTRLTVDVDVSLDEERLSVVLDEIEEATTELATDGLAGEIRLTVDTEGTDGAAEPTPGGTSEEASAGTSTEDDEGPPNVENEAVRSFAALAEREAFEAPLVDSQTAFEVYEDRAGRWRWRLRHENGNIIADSGGSYASRTGAVRGIRSVKRNAPGAAVE